MRQLAPLLPKASLVTPAEHPPQEDKQPGRHEPSKDGEWAPLLHGTDGEEDAPHEDQHAQVEPRSALGLTACGARMGAKGLGVLLMAQRPPQFLRSTNHVWIIRGTADEER